MLAPLCALVLSLNVAHASDRWQEFKGTAQSLESLQRYQPAVDNYALALTALPSTDVEHAIQLRAAMIVDLGKLMQYQKANSIFDKLLIDLKQEKKSGRLAADSLLGLRTIVEEYHCTYDLKVPYKLRHQTVLDMNMRCVQLQEQISENSPELQQNRLALARGYIALAQPALAYKALSSALSKIDSQAPSYQETKWDLEGTQWVLGQHQSMDALCKEYRRSHSAAATLLEKAQAILWAGSHEEARTILKEALRTMDHRSPKALYEEAELNDQLAATYLDCADQAHAEPYLRRACEIMAHSQDKSAEEEQLRQRIRMQYVYCLKAQNKFKELAEITKQEPNSVKTFDAKSWGWTLNEKEQAELADYNKKHARADR